MTGAKGKIAVSTGERNLYRLWKPLLILAVLVLVVDVVYYWSQVGFDVNLAMLVSDLVASNIVVFPTFLGLVALSFIVQYYYGSTKTRRGDMRARTPILVLSGFGVGLTALLLRWWISPSSPPRSIVSYVVRKPLVSGSAVALVIGGLVLAFFLSSRNEQRRILRAALIFLAAFLMFGGPTYLIYGLQNVGLPYPILVLGGLIAFVVGVLLFWRLVGKQTKLGVSE